MRQAILRLRRHVEEAVQQDDARFVIAACSDLELPYALHALEVYQEAFPRDFVVPFTTPFDEPNAWFERTVGALSYALSTTRAKDSVSTDAIALPESLGDETVPLEQRVRLLSSTLDAWFEESERGRVVLALLPSMITNWEAYAQVLSALLPVNHASSRLRCFVRDDEQTRAITNALDSRGVPYVELAFKFTRAAIEHHLAEEVVDRSLPTAERAQAAMQLAGMDMAHGRHELAANRFNALIAYFTQTQNFASSGLSHLCLADIALASNRIDLSRLHTLEALRDGLMGRAVPVVINATSALARLEERESRWLEAAALYRSAAMLASAGRNVQAAGDGHYDSGRCFWAGGDYQQGYDAWNRALGIAQQGGDWSRVIRVLEELDVALKPTNLVEHKAQISHALATAHAQHCGSGCTHSH